MLKNLQIYKLKIFLCYVGTLEVYYESYFGYGAVISANCRNMPCQDTNCYPQQFFSKEDLWNVLIVIFE